MLVEGLISSFGECLPQQSVISAFSDSLKSIFFVAVFNQFFYQPESRIVMEGVQGAWSQHALPTFAIKHMFSVRVCGVVHIITHCAVVVVTHNNHSSVIVH